MVCLSNKRFCCLKNGAVLEFYVVKVTALGEDKTVGVALMRNYLYDGFLYIFCKNLLRIKTKN